MKARRKPEEPTRKEVEEHAMHHAVYRPWCPHCVKGKGVVRGHRARPHAEEEAVPEVHMDYMFMDDDEVTSKNPWRDGAGMPILVAKDRMTNTIFAHVVPAKGVDGHAVRQMTRTLRLLGHKRLIFKTDGEPAIKALADAIRRGMDVDTVASRGPSSQRLHRERRSTGTGAISDDEGRTREQNRDENKRRSSCSTLALCACGQRHQPV